MNNRQAALIAANIYHGGIDSTEIVDVYRTADAFTTYLDRGDGGQDKWLRDIANRPAEPK